MKSGRTIPVPPHLRDAHYSGAEKLGHGKGYVYPHNSPDGFVPQDYLGQDLGKQYYRPKNLGREKAIQAYLQTLRDQIQELRRKSGRKADGDKAE